MQIFENGLFISCEDKNRISSVLIEDGGRIVFVGDVIPDTYRGIQKRIDMKGMCVVPLFADTHMHFESFSFFRSTLDIRHVKNFGELAAVIKRYENIYPEEKLLLGFGCSAHTVEEKRLPDFRTLDKITRKPLMLVKYDGHAAVANSALLKKLPGAITGNPGFDKDSGWLYRQAFYTAASYITRSVSLYKVLKTFINGNDYLARQGIGIIHTMAGIGFPLDVDVEMMRIAAKGFPLRYNISFQTMNVYKVTRRNLSQIGGCFATALDGCFGSEDAALLKPYSNNPGNTGVLVYPQNHVNGFIKRANRMGLQVSLHATGDAAVDQAITAFEAALEDFPRSDHRHIIIHANLSSRSLLERATRLGLHFAVQPSFLHWEQEPMDYLTGILGDRAYNLIPLKSMLDYGLTVAGGSDAPCTLPDPIRGMYAACNHPNPEQRISVLDALRMYTNWGARLSFDEEMRGTLSEGKCADFAVLDRNPLSLEPEKLQEIKVIGIYLNGRPYIRSVHKPFDLCVSALKNVLLS